MNKEKEKDDAGCSLSGFTVLIAEDYQFMSELLSGMLREFGVGKIILSESGQDAKDMIRHCNVNPASRDHIDILLVDWLMPNGNGPELLKWMRRHKKDSVRFLPAVLISAYTSEDVVYAARDNGANEALVKPVSAKALADRILYVINHPRPFVNAPDFAGPDRRRQVKVINHANRRKMDASKIEEVHEKL